MRAIQSSRHRRISLDNVMVEELAALAVAIARSSGPSNGFPHGIAIDANCSLPWTFWNAFSSTLFEVDRIKRLVSVRIVRPLFSGSSIVREMPSKSQPRISLRVSHVPSAMSFFTETGGPSGLLVISGGGNTLLIALRMVRASLRRISLSVLWISPMKSSM